jgi:hypothetical protein
VRWRLIQQRQRRCTDGCAGAMPSVHGTKCVSCHSSQILETGGGEGDFPASSLDIQIATLGRLC